MQPKKILIIDDQSDTREGIKEALKEAGNFKFIESADGQDGFNKIKSEKPDLTYLDVVLPKLNGIDVLREAASLKGVGPIIMITAYTNLRLAILATKFGAYNFIPKPFSKEQIQTMAKNALEKESLEKELAELKEKLVKRYHFKNITAQSSKMQEVLACISEVKESNVNVLILGETGAGKELVARAIHFSGPRKNRPLVTLNCAGIPDNLVESELFGYEKGAFTGAAERKLGKFELAHQSSIFMDEIGELPYSAQAKVLRMVDHKEFMRVGGTQSINADVRIISATNQDLLQKVKDKRFMLDLFYRLSVYPISVPSLRERKEDIPYLVSEFLELYSRNNNKNVTRVSREVMDLFLRYCWPGNVRELENMIARAVIRAQDDTIALETLDSSIKAALEVNVKPIRKLSKPISLYQAERGAIKEALKQSGENVIQAAALLGISKSALYRKINEFKL